MKKMRLTLFLVIANIAVLFVILKLEYSEEVVENTERSLVGITRLEVHSKNMAKPRIVISNKNKWEIISPIKWQANVFAVNRILSNLEFLDDKIGFSTKELEMRDQTLADYGLDDPAYTFNYGNDKIMYSFKIGNFASIGEKVYMLDSLKDRVIVADKQVADALIMDIDSLRSQNAINIAKVSSIGLRLPVKDPKTQAKSTWRRVGLAKDLDENWIFEAPFIATASNKAVEAFLSAISSAYIKSFDEISDVEAGLDSMSFPISITLDGTSKTQTLFLGHLNKETHTVYAKLSESPTIFSLDSTAFENLDKIQESLRSKDIMKFSQHSCNYIELSCPESTVTLKKSSKDTWDISGRTGDKLSEVASADNSLINTLLASLNHTVARAFVSDMKNEDLSRYGLAEPRLKISLGFDNAAKKNLIIGDSYKQGAVTLYYAKLENKDSIYAISGELINKYKANTLFFKSKLLYSLPENSKFLSIEIKDLLTNDIVISAKATDAKFNEYMASLVEKNRPFFEKLLAYCSTFYVKDYAQGTFDDMICDIDGQKYPWSYELKITVSMPGTGGDEILQKRILLTDRQGASLQYGLYKNELFELVDTLINSLYYLGVSDMPIVAEQND